MRLEYFLLVRRKKNIRVCFEDESGKSIFWNEISNPIQNAEELDKKFFTHEDLSYKEDIAKINLYNTSEYINISDKNFKVVRRIFSTDRPSMLKLILEEI